MAVPDEMDPFRILGVERDASSESVAQAYRTGAKRFHPDLHGPEAAHHMQQLNEAFRVLSDPQLRAAWEAAHPVGQRAPHWSTARADIPGRDVQPGGPAGWASWEGGRAAAAAGGGRLVVERGPRAARPAPASPPGVRDSAWLAAGVAGALVVGLLFLGWVASTTRIPGNPRQAFNAIGVTAASSQLFDPDHALGIFRGTGGTLGIVAAERIADGWQARILAEVATAQPISVIIHQDVAATDGVFSSVVFGRAEGGVAQVRLPSLGGRGGEVSNGTWFVVLSEPIDEEELTWEFLSIDGSVILRGTGQLGP